MVTGVPTTFLIALNAIPFEDINICFVVAVNDNCYEERMTRDVKIKVRLATDDDFKNIFSIWLDGIENSFDASRIDTSSLRQRFQRNFSQRSGIFNFWVAVDENQNIVGWQCLIKPSNNPLREDISAESSTYIASNCRYTGTGQMLLAHVIKEAENTDLEYIIAFVATTNSAAEKSLMKQGGLRLEKFLNPQKQ